MASTASTKSSGTVHTSGDAARDGRPQESSLHEHSTIALSGLIKFVIGFVIAAVVIHVIVWLIFAAYRSAVAQEREITGVNAPRLAPPEPRLQPSQDHNRLDIDDLVRMQAEESAELRRRNLQDDDGRFPTQPPPDLLQKINTWQPIK